MQPLKQFEPGVYIELNDTFSGTRKLARVTDTGKSYEDLDDAMTTPFPIYEEHTPVEVGNILGWGLYLVDSKPQDHARFKALVDKLIHSGEDVLTYNRAAYWAFRNANYDFDTAISAGRAATEVVLNGRAAMDTIIQARGAL